MTGTCQSGCVDLLQLSPVDDAVYRALLRRPGSVVAELAGTVGLSVERIKQSLVDLQARGLVRDLMPLRPDTVLEPALLQVEQELAATRTAVRGARRELGGLVELYVAGLARSERTVEVERIDSSAEAVQRRIDELSTGVSRELLAVKPSPTSAGLDEEVRDAAAMVARGVRMRTVLSRAAYDDPRDLQHAEALQEAGDEHRIHPAPPLQMLLLDRRVAIVPVSPSQPLDGALFVWSSTIVDSFLLLYEYVWEHSTPLSRGMTDGGGLTQREKRLLQLLAAGLKDEAIGRHLGISVRTVRRECAGLLERVGAVTRFEAGIHAARRGWL